MQQYVSMCGQPHVDQEEVYDSLRYKLFLLHNKQFIYQLNSYILQAQGLTRTEKIEKVCTCNA